MSTSDVLRTGEVPVTGTARTRGMSYYGNLGRILRDLTGFETLMFELLQNADDAGATKMSMDVGRDALTVANNSVFSDCGDQDLMPDECPYLAERGHRCDFHSFREVASGDKRGRDDSTGAFGIGFTTVYQVADTAVLISSGRRWHIDEMQPEASRIMEYPAGESQGTTFILPWARDPDSEFRRRTGTSAIDPADPGRLARTLTERLPAAMLFLRHLRQVEVLSDGESLSRYAREDADDICQITGGDESRMWLMLEGDFSEEAGELRGRFPGKIEDRRRAEITIAVPLGADVDGLLCAYLPTDEPSGLPAHVNADFYPASDRRHLITDSFHGEWNRLAVRAAARVLASRLPSLTTWLGHEQLWHLIYAAYAAERERVDTGIEAYWNEIGPVVSALPVMWTTSGEWAEPGRTVVLYSTDEDEAIPVLERLGILVVHPQVGAFVRRMRGLAGARMLTAAMVAQALAAHSLTAPVSVGDAPAGLSDDRSLKLLRKELDRLLARGGDEDRSAVRQAAVMPGADGRLWSAAQLRRADPDTMQMMSDLGLDVAFLDQAALSEDCTRLAALCPQLDLAVILSMLSGDQSAMLQEALEDERVAADSFLTWLRRHERAILANAGYRDQVRNLPAYPVGGAYRALDDLVLPGGFTDRLGIADAVDLEQIGRHEDFLLKLGAEPLSLHAYLTRFLPTAAGTPGMTGGGRWEQLVSDLAARLDEFAKNAEVRAALQPLPLVLCNDGVYRPGNSCYFSGKSVAAALGDIFPMARPLADHEQSTSTFYEWLGVARDPRLSDVVSRVTRIAGGPSDPRARTAVADVIGYLGKQMPDRGAPPPDTLKVLRDLAWLPVRGDSGWHAPTAVNSVFREQLFATQGRFLDVPRPVQQSAAEFLSWLGVEGNPTASQVVAHLLTRARQHEPVSPDVYTELNRKYDDPSILRLRDTACLLIDGTYVRPEAVFREANLFGRFRQRLGPGFDAIGNLLDVLRVKRIPGPEDAIAVLIDIAHEQAQRYHTPVEDPDDLAVVWQCWQMLDVSLAAGEIGGTRLAQLGRLAVIPDDTNVLTPPSRLLIDDMPGVASALNVGRAVIRRKEGMWRAFQAAGVQSFTEAVTVETIQLSEITRVGMVHARVHQRAPAFRRILDSVPEGHQRLTAILATLEFPESSLLRVRYHLPAFGLASPETDVRALYVPAQEEDGAQLISCPGPGDDWPWMLIAKELARALYPGEAPGLLSSSLYVVLNAESLDMAHRALDDAGMPRLEHVDFTVTDSGLDAQFEDAPDGGDQPDGDTDTSEVTESCQSDQPDAPVEPPEASDPADEESGSENPDSQADAQDRSGNPELDDRAPGKDDRAASPGSGPADRQRPRGRLRSYVSPENKEGASRDHRDTSPVDEAGIERVLRAELAAGRHSEVMPHNNPGFDIISRDERGDVVRHIEVKSVSGAWDALGVGLTRTQFDFGRQHPETFWLYVVEHALDDERAQIQRIADPAGQAQEFLFDGGWAALSDLNPDGTPTGAGVNLDRQHAVVEADRYHR